MHRYCKQSLKVFTSTVSGSEAAECQGLGAVMSLHTLRPNDHYPSCLVTGWLGFNGILSRRSTVTRAEHFSHSSLSACIYMSGTLTLRAERQSALMSKIANDGLTRSGTGCFVAVPIWQQWASKG